MKYPPRYRSDKCFRCDAPSEIHNGNYSYCAYHYRHMQMRVNAKKHGKAIPTKDELTELLNAHSDMICPNCRALMHWLGRDGRKHVITLQHNHSGTFGILCHSCNSAHQFIPNDGFYSKPKGSRFCQDCKKFLPLDLFFKDSGLKGGVKTYCKQCANVRTYEWRRKTKYQGKFDWVAY